MNNKIFLALTVFTGYALWMNGCGQLREVAGPSPSAPLGGNITASNTGEIPLPYDIEVEVIGVSQLNAALDQHHGKVVLIDFWATWCGPCRQKFPHTIELAEKYAGQGLEVITVSLDNKNDLPEVKSFLINSNATADNLTHFISQHKTGQSVIQFEIGDSIPYYKVYDREGNLIPFPAMSPEQPFPPEAIESLVSETLAK